MFDSFIDPTSETFTYDIATGIFLNISNYTIYDQFYNQCNYNPISKKNKVLFGIGSGFLFISTVLRYGHQLSKYAEKWVNDYFAFEEEDLPLAEYLNQFKGLEYLIEEVEGSKWASLYHMILVKKLNESKHKTEELTGAEALRALEEFQKFYTRNKSIIKEEPSEEWKRTWASRLGWAITLIATYGRMVIFQYVIAELLGSVWGINDSGSIDFFDPSTGAIALSCIFGYTVAHLAQGFVEKEAVEEGIYEILGGKKAPNGSSHPILRTSLKIWDYLYGVFCTLPYLVIGFAAVPSKWGESGVVNLFQLTGNSISNTLFLFLLTYGIADIFNNVVAFHRSNDILINSFDSLLSPYYAFEGYKRDKLVCITRQLCNLFKDLSPSIVKEISPILDADQDSNLLRENGHAGNIQRGPPFIMETGEVNELSVTKALLSAEENLQKGTFVPVGSLQGENLFSPKAQAFLTYIKRSVVDGILDWKEKAGVGVGLVTGLFVAWPLMIIIFDDILNPYTFSLFENAVHNDFIMNVTDPDVLSMQFQTLNTYLNSVTSKPLV